MAKEQYIEREELLQLYDPTSIPDAEHLFVPFLVVRQNILDVPVVDVRPVVKGEWEYDAFSCDWICSNCDLHSMEHGKFCPNCGADMRLSKE